MTLNLLITYFKINLAELLIQNDVGTRDQNKYYNIFSR